MKTKNSHTNELLSGKNHPMIEIFFEYAQLKNLYRQGWLKRGVSDLDCETVAEHSFSVALLGYTIAEEYRKDLNSNRVMKLGLFHEIGEIYAGDIIPADNISLKDKSQMEYEAVKKVFSKLSSPEKYINIWLEFEHQKTSEAKFVKEIDKLEMALQANLYEKMNYNSLDEFFNCVQKSLKSPELKSTLEEIIQSRN